MVAPDEMLPGSINLASLNELTHPATQSARLPLKEVSPVIRSAQYFWGVEAGYVIGPVSLPGQSTLCFLQK
jgi:hypothetical protein